MPRSWIESASSRNVSAGKSLRGCNGHGRTQFNGTWRTWSPGDAPGVGAVGVVSAGVVGATGAAGAGLEMTGVPPNSAPRPRPKAGFAMRAECRRAGELSISLRAVSFLLVLVLDFLACLRGPGRGGQDPRGAKTLDFGLSTPDSGL